MEQRTAVLSQNGGEASHRPPAPSPGEGVSLQVLVTGYMGTEKCQLTFAGREPPLPRGGPCLSREARQGVSSPPSLEPGAARLGSVTGTPSGGEERTPRRPGRSMGWEGPGHPGHLRGHLLPLAVSFLLLVSGPEEPNLLGVQDIGGPVERDICPLPAETTTRTSAPGGENNLTVTSASSPDSRVTAGVEVSLPHPGHSTSTAALGASEHPRAPLPGTPTATAQTQAGSVRFTGEAQHTRQTETNRGVASNVTETAVSPSPAVDVPGLPTLKSSPPKGTSPGETTEARHGPVTHRRTVPTGVTVTGSSSAASSFARTSPSPESPASSEIHTGVTVKSAPVTSAAETGTDASSHTPGGTHSSREMLSPTYPETSSRETPDSREPASPRLSLSHTGRPLASPEPGSERDTTLTSHVPLLSPASDLRDQGSGSSKFSMQRLTTPLITGTPFLMTPRNTASAGNIPSPTSALARPSPSGEGTTGMLPALSTSPGAPDTARTLALELSGGPTALSINSISRVKPFLSPSPSSALETHTDSVGPEFPTTSPSSRTSPFTSVAARSQTHTGTLHYPTAPRDNTWLETNPSLETKSPSALSAVPAAATPPAATGVAPRSSVLNTGSMGGMSPKEPSTAMFPTQNTRGPATVGAPASSGVQPVRGDGGDRKLGTTQLLPGTPSPSETSMSSSPRKTPARTNTGKSPTVALGTSAPSMGSKEETVPPSSPPPASADSSSFSLGAHTRSEHPSTVVETGSDSPLTSASGKTTTAVSIAKMDTKETSNSSGSPPDMSVPGKTSPRGTSYVTPLGPRVTRTAQVTSSRPVKELRTVDTYAKTESTSPVTHSENPKTPRPPGPTSPATTARTSTDTAERSTGSQGPDLAEKSPGFGTQSTPGPASGAATASPTSRSSTWELTSDAAGASLTPMTSKENTVTSWLWALTTSLPVATWLSTSSTEDTASTVPDISSPSSSETFATSVPSYELSSVGGDSSALPEKDLTPVGQPLGGGTDTASQQLTVDPEPSTDGTVESITNFPTYESSSWLNSDLSTPMTVDDPAAPKVATNSVTEKSELETMTSISTMVTPSIAFSKKAVTAEPQTSGSEREAHSSTSPWSEQTAGWDPALSASPADPDTAITTPLSDRSESSATISLISMAREKARSSAPATSPFMGPKSESITGLETPETSPPPAALSVTSSPTELTSKGGVLAVEVITSSPRGTRSVSTVMPSPERKSRTSDSTQAPGTSPWSITDTAAYLHVTGLPGSSSTGTTLASSAVAIATAEQQASMSVGEAYSAAVTWSEKTTGSDPIHGASPEGTDTWHLTTRQRTTSPSVTFKSQATTGLTYGSGRILSSSPSITFPSMGSKTLVAITSVVAGDAASTTGQRSQTSSPAEANITDVTVAPTPDVATTITTMGNDSVLTTVSNPERRVSTLVTETRMSTQERPSSWSPTTASVPTSSSWAVTDTASMLEATGSTETTSAMGTLSLASSTESGSLSTSHGLGTILGTSLAIPSPRASAEDTKSTNMRTWRPSDTTPSMPISTTSGIERMSPSYPHYVSTSGTNDHPSTKTDPKISPPISPSDFRPTLDWATGKSVSSSTDTTSRPQGGTMQEVPVENKVSPTTSQLPVVTAEIKSGFTPTKMGTGTTDASRASWAETPSAGTQGFTRSLVTSSADTGSEDVSQTSLSSDHDTTSPSPLVTSHATTSPTLISPTSQARVLSRPVPATSPTTLGTTGTLNTSVGPVTSPHSSLNSISGDFQVISEASTATQGLHVSRNTAVTSLETITSTQETQSSDPAGSEKPKGTTTTVTTSLSGDTSLSTPVTGLSETTESETLSTSSPSLEPWETSTSQHTIVDLEKMGVPSPASADPTAEDSRTHFISSSRTSIPGPAQSTVSPDISTGIHNRLSTSSILTESTAIAMVTETALPRATSWGTSHTGASTTASWAASHSAGTQVSISSVETISVDTGSEVVSQTSPASDQDTTSPSPLVPSHATTSPSLHSPTSQARDPTSPVPATSPGTPSTMETTGILNTTLRTVTSPPSGLSSTPGDTQVISEVSTAAEGFHLSGNTAVTNIGTLALTQESQSSAPAGSETPKGTNTTVTTSFSGDTSFSTPVTSLSETTEFETPSMSSLDPEPWNTGTSQHTVVNSEKITVPSLASTDANMEASRTNIISSSRTSIPAPAPSTMSSYMGISSTFSTYPDMNESTAIAMVTKTDLPGTTAQDTKGLHLSGNTVVTNIGTLVSTQESQSSAPAGSETPKGTTTIITSSRRGDTSISTPVTDLSETTEFETHSMSSLGPEPWETGTSQHSVVNSEKITVPSLASTDATMEASRTNIISSSRISIPGPAQSTMSPDISTGIHNRLSTSSILTESTAIAMVPETALPGATSMDGSATASWAESHSAGTRVSTSSVVTVSTHTGPEVVSQTSPASDQDTTSPLPLVPSHATTSPSLHSPTSQARDPTSTVPATSPGTPSTMETTGILNTTLGTMTSPPSGLSSTPGDTQVISEVSTAAEGFHLSGNTAVTNIGTLTSTQESQSSAPAVSETPKGTATTVTTSLSGDTSFSTPVTGLSETMESETLSTSSPRLEPWEISTSQHTIVDSEKMSVPSPASTDTTAEDSRTNIISSSRTSIPGSAQSTMSPDISTGIHNRLSTSSILTESTAIAMVPETALPGATSQDTSTTDGSATASWAESHSAGTQVSTSSVVTVSVLSEPWDTGTSQHSVVNSEKITVPSLASTDATMEASRTNIISSSRTSIPGPAQSTMSPDISTGIHNRLSTSSILTESTAIAMVPETELPGTTSQDTSTTDASTMASWAESHSAGTQASTSSVVTISVDTGSEVVSQTSPASDQDTTSPSPLVPSHATTSPSLHSPTSQARDPTTPVPATSPGTPSTMETTGILNTTLRTVTSPPSGLSSTPGDTQVISEVSTAAEGFHLSGNTAVTNIGTLASTQESQSSAPADSETPKGTNTTVTTSLSGDTSFSTPVTGLSETMESETLSTSSPRLEPWGISTSQHSIVDSEKMSVPSPASTDTTAEDSRTNIISSSRTSIPGPAQSTMSPDISTGIHNRLSTSSILTESTAIAMVPETALSGATSQDTSSETPKGTTSIVTSSRRGDTSISTPVTGLSETTEFETHSMLSLGPEPWDTGTSQHSVVNSEKITVPSLASTDATMEASRTNIISSSRTSIPGPAQSTMSPDISTGIHNRLSTSSILTESTAIAMVTETELPGTTSQDTSTTDASATASWAESHSAGTQVSTSSVVTVSVLSGSEVVSQTSPASDQDTTSPSPLHSVVNSEKITVPSLASTDATMEASRTNIISSSRTSIPGPAQSTMSPDMAIHTRFSTYPDMTESTAIAMVTKTELPGTSSQDTSSETPKGTTSIVTSSRRGDTSFSTPVTGLSETTEFETHSMSSLGPEPWDTGTSQHTVVNSEKITVPSLASTDATMDASRTNIISSSRTSIPGPAPSPMSPYMGIHTRFSTYPDMTESTAIAMVTKTDLPGTTSQDTKPWDTGTSQHSVVNSEKITVPSLASTDATMEASRTNIISSSRTSIPGPAQSTMSPDISTGIHNRLSTSSILTESTAIAMVTETELPGTTSQDTKPWDTGTSQHSVVNSEKITVPSLASTDATMEASRTNIISSSRTSIPGPAQSTMSPDMAIHTRFSTYPDMTESTAIAMVTKTELPGTSSQDTSTTDASTMASWAESHSARTQVSTSSVVTISVDTGSEVVSQTSPASDQDTTSPSPLVPSHATTSPSLHSPTSQSRDPTSTVPATSPGTPSTMETTGTLNTTLGTMTSPPSGLSSTPGDTQVISEVSTAAEGFHLSGNTAVTIIGTLASTQESQSSAPAGSETPKGTTSIVTSSRRGDTSFSTPVTGLSETTEFETHSMSSLGPEPWDTGTSQHTVVNSEKITVPSLASTDATMDASRTNIISSSRTSIPGPAPSPMSPYMGIHTRFSTYPDMTESTAIAMVTKTDLPGTTSQDTKPWDTGTSQHSVVNSEKITVPSLASTDATMEASRTNIISSSRTSIPGPAQSTMSPDISTGIHNRLSTSSILTESTAIAMVTETELPGTTSQDTKPWDTGTSQHTVVNSEKITVPSLASTDATMDASRTNIISSSRTSIPGPAPSPMSPYMGIHTRFSTYPDMTESTAIAMVTKTDLPGTTSQDTKPWDTSTSWHTIVTSGKMTVPSTVVTDMTVEASKTNVISSIRTSIPGPSQSTISPDIPTGINTRLSTSALGVDPGTISFITPKGCAGRTSFPEPRLSMSISEKTSHLSTVMLSSAETISTDTWVPSLSTASSGVPGASSATFSTSPYRRTEPGPGDAMPTIAENLPSSASIPFPSSPFTTAYSSTNPALYGITSSLVTQRMVGTNTEAERSTAEGPLVVVSTLETWTEPVRTSLPSIMDTRMTEHIHFGTVTSASQLPSQSTQLTRTDGIVEQITKKPNEAAHGEATGPAHVSVALTSSASPKGPPTEWTESAEIAALKTTSTATLTTTVSTPTSGMLTLLGTSGKMASTSTRGTIFTTPDVSPDVLEMTASLATRPGAATSTELPRTTSSVLNRGSETTPSLVPSSGAKNSPAVPTLTSFPGVPEMVTSLVTSPGAETSMVISTLDSQDEPETSASWVTHPVAQSSSSTPTPNVFPGEPGLMTSLDASVAAETSPAGQTPTISPGKPDTTVSLITHPESQTGSAIPTPTVSPSILGVEISPVTNSGESDSMPSTATSLETEASSAAPTTPISLGVPDMVTSQATSSGTGANISFSTATTPGAEVSSPSATTVSPTVPGLVTLLATSSETEANTTLSTLTDSLHELETTASWASHPAETSPTIPKATPSFPHSESDTTHSIATSSGAQTISAILTPAGSPGVSGVEISLVTSSEAETSTTLTTFTVSPGQLETTASWVTHSENEASSAAPTLNISSEEPETAVSLITHPAETSPTVPRTIPSFSHSESYTTPLVATSHGAEISSVVSTPTLSPGVPDMMTSQVTSAEKEASMAISTLNLSPVESVTTAMMVTHSGAQTSSAIPAPTVSSTVPELVTSMVTSTGEEASTSFTTLTVSPGQLEITASWVTHSGTEASSAVPTQTDFTHKSDITVSLVTHSAETSPNTSVPTTPLVFSESEPDTTHSIATSLGAEVSSVVSSPTISPGVPDMVTSQAPSSETDADMTIPSLTLSPSEPASTALLVTQSSTKTITNFPSSTAFPHFPETIQPQLEISAALPTQTISPSPAEITSFTTPVTKPSGGDLGPTISLGVPVETASLSTHPGTDISTISTSTLAPILLATTGLLAPSPASDVPTLTPGVLGPVSTPAITGEPSPPVTSVGLPEFSKTVTLIASETPTPPKTGHGEGLSSTTVLKTTTLETTSVAATGSGPIMTENTTTFSTSAGSPFVPETSPGVSTMTSVSVTSETSPGVSLGSLPTTTAAVPFLMPFTVNVTITNLYYTEDMENSGSEIFNATERNLQDLLRTLFKNSSIGSLYAGCRLTLLRAEKDGISTRMDAVCTYHPDPTGFRLDRERLYWELSQQTHGVARLGPYTLDRDSLFVNGYNPQYWIPTTNSTGVGPDLVPFTLNFTITNLLCTPDMTHPGSIKFNSTETALNHLLGPLFKNTSIGPLYSGCRLTLLRTEKDGAATGVDAICTYRPDPTGPRLNREELYQELSQLTHGVTQLGTYTLDRDSLYVNGYNHRYWTPTTSSVSLSLVPFTLNFTITSLRYTEDMGSPGSQLFSSTERTLNRLLKPLFQNSSIGPLYYGCRLTLLRPEKKGTATGVDAVCTYHPDPAGPKLDREKLYWELSQQTHGVTQLGFFTLDKNSLYVNGYNHWTSAPTPSAAVTPMLFPRTSVVPTHFSSYTDPQWMPETMESTGPYMHGLLFPSPATAAVPFLVPFTLNFTITNLHYEESMQHPGSWKFNSTEKILQGLLKLLFRNSSLGFLYSGCSLASLRPEKDGAATRVDAMCMHRPDPEGLGLDREQLYWELSQLTHGITLLGHYTLDRNSLYVNGFTHQSSAPITNTPGTSTVHLGTSGTPSSFPSTSPMGYTHQVLTSNPSTTGPALVPFTLNFTITNLHHQEGMSRPGSWRFNNTQRNLQRLFGLLFKNTSVGPLYSGCRLTLLRPEKDGAATGVDAICTHRPDPVGPGLDREQLYQELSQLTRGVTRLGPYTLDPDSLYINGYTGQTRATTPSASMVATVSAGVPTSFSSPTAAGPAPVPFTLNFTITNLHYTKAMRPGSAKFNFTESILQGLLEPLFANSSIGSLYTHCRVTMLRPEKSGTATGVDAVCTYQPDPSGLQLDREQLYWELSHQTHGVTQLGSYILDRDSLYVNGYTRPPPTSIPRVPVTSMPSGTSAAPIFFSSSTVSGPDLVPFTLNFTITNLRYTEDMQLTGSAKFNETEMILQSLLRPLFKKTSVGPLYSGCRLTSLRPQKAGAATRVNAVCFRRPDPAGLVLDRERLYWELSRLTHGVTRLGHYTLEEDSLCVSGYTHQTPVTAPSATGRPLVPFTLNFTVTNIHYTEDMQPPGSQKFNSTEKSLQLQLGLLFKNSSVGPLYSSCRLTLLRPEKDGAATGVDAICTHRPDPVGPGLDREQLYQELSQLTRGVTRLGPYTLDPDSLYINGYTGQTRATTPSGSTHPASATTPSTTGPTLVSFTLNFTIANLHYTQDMGHPASSKFNSTERILQHRLRLLFSKTIIGPLYAGCRLTSLRLEKGGAATGVDILCIIRSDSADPRLDREHLYWELSRETYGITQLGSFTLDRDSLYVNGYTYGTIVPTTTTGEVSEEPFTLNFTIDNLRYSADMGRPGSLKFNITDSLMQHLLGPLFQRSSLGARYAGCKVTSLRSVKNGAKTRVDILCTYRQPPSSPGLPAKQVFHELSRQTRGITRLGPYSLDKDSLYLNGYNERGPDEPPTTPEAATTFLPRSSSPTQPEATTAMGYSLKTLTLNFTISNLQYSVDMSNGSAMFNSTKRTLQRLLGSLFQKSSLGPFYSDCRLISLRPEKDGPATHVDAICTYRHDSMGHGLDREQLYWELYQLTHGVTQMGFYTLVHDSLFVNGYAPQSLSTQWEYQLNFRIINWNLSNPDPTSLEYTALWRDIQDKVTKLYSDSQLQDIFRSCLVTNLTLSSMLVTIQVLFSSNVDPSVVKKVFLDKTLNVSSHWLGATYQLTDLHVTEVEPSAYLPTDIPTSSPSPEHFQLNFTVTNLLYSPDLAQPDTTKHRQNKRSIENALNQVFQNSNIKSFFSGCQVLAFRSVPDSNHTGVDSLCNFSPLARKLDRVAIYLEFLRLTKNGTQLQNFTLDRNSVLVDGYSPNRNDVLTENSDLPYWAIILICLAGLLVLITCLICCFLVTVCRRKKEGGYEVQQRSLGYYLPHLDLRKLQ
ncbi:mucin-16 [Meles meles]|uniref:mucin-16 n=1 Tax=Meles meles TaxID=9662 RepID=UPI001E699E26|nr:mucin-16 [Meles meles]